MMSCVTTTRGPMSTGAAALILLTTIAGCSTSAPSASPVSPDGSSASTASTVSSASGSAPTGTGGGAGSTGDPGYQVAFAPVTQQLPTPPGAPTASVTYPEVTVTAGPDAAVRTAVHDLVTARIAAARKDFSATLTDVAPGVGESREEITVAREVRWGRLWSVQLADYRSLARAAHPIDGWLAVTVDWRTGRAVGLPDLFPAPGPVDRAVRTALGRRVPEAGAADPVTVGPAAPDGSTENVPSYPTPAGLWVGVPECVLVCALGALEVTVPWQQLPSRRPGALPSAG